jgi:hypothetical protein
MNVQCAKMAICPPCHVACRKYAVCYNGVVLVYACVSTVGGARTKAGVVLSSVSRGGQCVSARPIQTDPRALLYYTAFLA